MSEWVPGLGNAIRYVTELAGSNGRCHEVRYVRVAMAPQPFHSRSRIVLAGLLRSLASHIDGMQAPTAA